MPLVPPEVLISVDSETGVWLTDGMPMIYLPRHFYINHREALQEAFGAGAVDAVFYRAGYRSAWEWCDKEAKVHNLRGMDVFRHYLKRLSQRGWGRFSVLDVDEATGAARIGLDHSIYVGHAAGKVSREPLCDTFSSWMVGALEWVGKDQNRGWNLQAHETCCAGQGGCAICIIEASAAGRGRKPIE